MLFRRLSVQPEPLDDGEYDSDASDDDVTEHELIDAAKAAASGDIEVLVFLFSFCHCTGMCATSNHYWH